MKTTPKFMSSAIANIAYTISHTSALVIYADQLCDHLSSPISHSRSAIMSLIVIHFRPLCIFASTQNLVRCNQ